MKKIFVILFIFLLPCICLAQNELWKHYYSHNNVTAIAAKGDYVWIGYDCGLERHNIITGQTDQYFTYNSGLPVSNIINAISIDSSGNLWVSTGIWNRYDVDYWNKKGGIVRFDGINWKDYSDHFQNSGTGIVPDATFIAADKGDIKWIVTYNALWKGYFLSRFDEKTDSVYSYPSETFQRKEMNITSAVFDSQGNRWFATRTKGLLKYDGKNWQWVDMQNSGLPSNALTSITIDKKGSKWIGTFDSGLARFDSSGWKVYNQMNSGLPDDHITAVTIDSADNIWIGMLNGGIARFNGAEWKVYNDSTPGLKDNNITCITVDSKGDIWAGTSTAGYAKFNGSEWITSNNSTSKLNSNFINGIAADSTGNIWIITNSYEIYRFKDKEWTNISKSVSDLAGKFIYKAAVGPKSEKWFLGSDSVSSYSTFAARYNDTSWVIFDSTNTNPLIKKFYTLAFDSIGSTWFAIDNGLAKYDGKDWTVYPMSDSAPSLYSFIIFSMAAKGDGNILLGHDSGIMRFDGSKWFEFYRGYRGLAGVHDIKVDHRGSLWAAMGTYDGSRLRGGLTKFDWYKETGYGGNLFGCSTPWTSCIAIEKENNRWIGGWCGLARIDGSNDTVYSVFNTSNSGLPENDVTGITIDRYNHKWIGTTDAGIAEFSLDEVIPSGVRNDEKGVRLTFSLSQNYPNPFNPVTTIGYSLEQRSFVSLKVYDILGREAAVLEEGYRSSGTYKVKFDGTSLPSGIYIYRLKAGQFWDSKKCVIIK